MRSKREDTKTGEMLYVSKQDEGGYEWLIKKPFGSDRFVPHYFLDFGLLLSHLELPAGSRVLDMGCGSGWHADWLAQCGYRVVGIDISTDMIRVSLERLGRLYREEVLADLDLLFLCADSENLPLSDGMFQGVVMYEMLHHLPEWKKALSEVTRVLQKGGRLVIIDPSVNHYDLETMDKYGNLERGVHPQEIKKYLLDQGFECVKIKIEPVWLKTEIGREPIRSTSSTLFNELLCAATDALTVAKRLRTKYILQATK